MPTRTHHEQHFLTINTAACDRRISKCTSLMRPHSLRCLRRKTTLQVFLPYWLMQNLLLSEGARVELRSLLQPPAGSFVRFKPHNDSFLGVAARQVTKRSDDVLMLKQTKIMATNKALMWPPCVQSQGNRCCGSVSYLHFSKPDRNSKLCLQK